MAASQKCIDLEKFPKIHSKLKYHLFYVNLLAYLTITGIIILVLYACKIYCVYRNTYIKQKGK